jgi:hypothetical protein
MTRETAIEMLGQYCALIRTQTACSDPTIFNADKRFPADGSERKAMRWLGFIQGAAYARGYFTLEQIKEHSKNGRVT